MRKSEFSLWVQSLALTLMLVLIGAGVSSMWTDDAFAFSFRHPLKHQIVSGQTDVQDPTYDCSIKVPEPEPSDLTSLATIKADDAMAAALAKYPSASVVKVELENENGCLVYSIDLSNRKEVKVDAGDGAVLHEEQEGYENED